MENALSLDLGLGDGLIAVKSEEIYKEEEEMGAKIRETQREKHKRKEMHDEEYFLKLSLRSVICEQEFSNAEESMKGRNIKRALSIEEVDQIRSAAISSSSNIKSSEAQSKNDIADSSIFETEKEDGAGKKKLRLTRDQAYFLEDSFKKQSILNPKQKLVLSKQLNLKPRQVEVWFQNRRARNKLKKTEMDYENLKRCCHMLTLENRRLQREVAELRMLRENPDPHPLYMHIKPTLCLSCKRANVSSSTSVATVTFDNQPNSFATILTKRNFDQIVTARQ